MKANVAKFEPKSVSWVDKGDGFQFVRKGQVGASRELFTAAQEARLGAYLTTVAIPKCCESFARGQPPSSTEAN